MGPRAYNAALGVLVLANLVFVVYIVYLWSPHFRDPAPQASAQPTAPLRPPPPRAHSAQSHEIAAKPKLPRNVLVRITAARGNCWISAHRGSATGPVLAEETLAVGQSVSLRAPRIWLELAAAGYVDVTVDGKPRPVGTGTTKIVLG